MAKDREEKITIDSQGRILLFGTPVGTIQKGNAVVDSSCQLLEMNRFLFSRCRSVKFQSGIAKKLEQESLLANAHRIRRARIYQLKTNVDPALRFTSYQERIARYGRVTPQQYTAVFDGEVNSDDPEIVYRMLRDNPPAEYKGHILTRSDVLELYNPTGSRFFYVDTFALKPIDFNREDVME